jgi:hypothetical protein
MLTSALLARERGAYGTEKRRCWVTLLSRNLEVACSSANSSDALALRAGPPRSGGDAPVASLWLRCLLVPGPNGDSRFLRTRDFHR